MFLKSVVLGVSLLLPAATWAQFGKTDVMKLAGGHTDAVVKALKLTPQQTSVIKPLLDSKLKEMAGVKKEFANGDKSDAAKDIANDSLKAISSKYDSKITSTLKPDQLKKWAELSKGWNSVI